MKNQIKILAKSIFILTLLFSCSNDSTTDDNGNDDTGEGGQQQYKLLKSVTYPDFWSDSQTSIQFAYENGQLTKELDDGELLYISYNNDNKVSEVKECSDSGVSDINVDTYNCTSFYGAIIYGYESGILTTLNSTDYQNDIVTLSYDGNGNLISEVGSDSPSEDVFYNYDSNGNVTSLTLTYQGESTTYTYELDGKKNPFNVFWEVFGYKLGDLGFEPYDLVSGIFKQNAKKYFKGSELQMEASYTYDADGYPLTCVFTEYLTGGDTRTGTITYSYYVD